MCVLGVVLATAVVVLVLVVYLAERSFYRAYTQIKEEIE